MPDKCRRRTHHATAQAPDKLFPQLTVLSVAELMGEAIGRVYSDSSMKELGT